MSTDSKTAEKFIIMPYRKIKGKLIAAEMRPSTNEVSAIRIATSMSERFAGVVAYGVQVDEETGDMNAPRLLVKFGEVPDLTAE